MSPALFLLAAVPGADPAPAPAVSVPPGFAVKLVADDPLAPNIYAMTLDDAGRVLVAGPGYVRVLVDDNGDGVADRAVDLIDGLKGGPMGLFAERDSLYVVADGGLKRYRGYDGKSKFTAPPETLLAVKTTGEHDAHAVRRGPDGWLYLLCGNMAGVTKDTITGPRSPVKDPVAGTLLRLSPDVPELWGFRPPRQVEVVADGFRNPYGFDFNLDGEPFAYDSDNERCVGLPWYEPCRFYHVVPGGNYGWRSPQLGQFWRKPPYFIDCVPPVCYTGRGSPTGVACYRHTHFPAQYRGGFFLADWTFGRVHFVPLTPKHSSYEGKPEVFAEAVGTSGFAPTALAVHPKTGELFVSIGGRGTRGGVYRITHEKNPPGQALPVAKRSLGWTPDDEKRWLADCTGKDDRLRRTTLELMLRARGKITWSGKLTDAVKPNLSHPDPLVRMAAGRTVKPLVVPLGAELTDQARLMLALSDVTADAGGVFRTAVSVLENQRAAPELKLQAVRLVQLACGDFTNPIARGTALEGYTLGTPPDAKSAELVEHWCLSLLRSPDENLRREGLRTLAGLRSGRQEAVHEALKAFRPDSAVAADLELLIVLARLQYPSPAALGRNLADTVLNLDRKAVAQRAQQDTFWPLRVSETVAALVRQVPRLPDEVVGHPDFGRPEHLIFVKPLGIDPVAAAKRFLAVAAKDKDYRWTPGVVGLLNGLPAAERLSHLRKLWDKPELRDAIIRVLPAVEGQQPRFVVGLASFDPEVVRIAAAAISGLSAPEGNAELAAAVKALRRLDAGDKAARAAVVELLRKRTGEKFDADLKAWTEWLAKNRPEAAKLLASTDGFDAVAWKKREAAIPWDTGDAVRGKAAFLKASCAACHDGGRALGPSLLGVTKRFGRDDLLTSILQPGKDVPARYRPVRVTTTDDTVHIGMLVYEATDGVILQTNADTAVRIGGDKIASKRPVDASLMPAGLLDKLTDADIADLFAYLKTLEDPKPK